MKFVSFLLLCTAKPEMILAWTPIHAPVVSTKAIGINSPSIVFTNSGFRIRSSINHRCNKFGKRSSICTSASIFCTSFNHNYTIDKQCHCIRERLRSVFSCLLFMVLIIFGDAKTETNFANAITTGIHIDGINSDVYGSSINIKSIQQSLVPPTLDKPQIIIHDNIMINNDRSDNFILNKSNVLTAGMMPKSTANGTKKNTKVPIVEGMIYLQNNQERPQLNDNIVVTLSSLSSKSNSNDLDVLAGAKYQVYKAKFPFNFKMYYENILKGKEDEWNNLMSSSSSKTTNSSDLIVTVRVCPEEVTQLPCAEEESTFIAKGVSKLLMIGNLPGGEEGQIIRTPVSLPLTMIK